MQFLKLFLVGSVLMLPITNAASADTKPVARPSGDCLDIAAVADQDVSRNAAIIVADQNLCISKNTLSENGMKWKFTIISNTKHKAGPTVFLPHDNENSAFDTALYSVRKYGGRLVAVEAADSRSFQKQDPNRNFGITVSETKVCRDMRKKPAAAFTKYMLSMRQNKESFFLTMHNNANGHSGNGGSGGISAGRNSAVMHAMMAPKGGDEDDAILLAGTKAFDENKMAAKAVKYFHKKGINVIYEHVRASKNDCSFSNFVVLNKLSQYYNIEAQHGHTAQQKRMLDSLMKFHKIRVRNKKVK